jgi:hypothetical protein
MALRQCGIAILLCAGFGLAVAADLETSLQALKDAQSNKDAAEVKKLAAETIGLAKQAAAAPAPAAEDEKAAWKQSVDYAKSAQLQAEYALLALALQGPPETTIDLIATLEQQNPKSKYLDDAYPSYFQALTKTGAADKIPEVADKALASLPDNDDLLLYVMDRARTRNQLDRALTCATRLVSVLSKHPKPEGIAAGDWEKKRTFGLAQGYWTAGVISAEKSRYADADKYLRAALPMIAGNDAQRGPALFYLGVANYQLGKMTLNKAKVLEGAKFSQEASTVQGPLAGQAYKNALLIKDEAAKMR